VPNLTERQAQFVHHLVTTGLPPPKLLARSAMPSQTEAYRLTRTAHVIAAIRVERDRLISAHGANLALATLSEIMRDRQAPASARVSASRAMLEAARVSTRTAATKRRPSRWR
jgi:hypothetical protein